MAINLIAVAAVLCALIALIARNRRAASWVGAGVGAVVAIGGFVALRAAFDGGQPEALTVAYFLAAIASGSVLAIGCLVRLRDRRARSAP